MKSIERRTTLLVLFILSSLSACSGLKVLAFLPFPMKSHQILFNILVGELVGRGHEVTAYTSVPLRTNATNYRHIHVTSKLETTLAGKYSFDNIKPKLDLEAFIRPMGFQLLTSDLSEEILVQPQIQSLLASNEKFDVVILETFFGQEAFVGLGHIFNAPVVSLMSFGSFSLPDSLMGNPNPLAYLSTYQLAYTSDMTFYQRLKNVIATLSELHYSYYHHLPKQQAIYERHFTSQKRDSLPPLMDLLTDIAVLLVNTQPEVNYARPYVPNVVPIGGFHIPSNRAPLPQDIQKFIDGADNGFIYFSLGSTFSGATMPDYMRDAFIEAFRKIPQRVLWKIDMLPSDLPPNVMTAGWVQQVDVLAQRNCRAFITHGGLLSVLEAVHFAIPLIGVPVFADQPSNMVKVEQAEIGIRLRVLNISTEAVSWAVDEILHNSMFKRNIVQLSGQMRDKLVSPLETAVYWIEYVANHQGAPHMRSPGRKLSSFHYLLLDVVLLLLSMVLLVFVVLYVLVSRVYRIYQSVFSISINSSSSSKGDKRKSD